MTVFWSVLIVLGALAAAAGGGMWVVGSLLKMVGPDVEARGLLRGGRWIGILERLAITGAIISGFPEAAAVVIAVKGLGRYPELRGRTGEDSSAASERFIVGTLASFVWAALLGIGALAALSALR